jgi:hypothetical protein
MKKEYDNLKIVVKIFENCDVITSSSNSFANDGVWDENPWGGVGNYFKEAVGE